MASCSSVGLPGGGGLRDPAVRPLSSSRAEIVALNTALGRRGAPTADGDRNERTDILTKEVALLPQEEKIRFAVSPSRRLVDRSNIESRFLCEIGPPPWRGN